MTVALFCGSREWADREAIVADLSGLPDGSVIIEGGARGADRLAKVEAIALGFHIATVTAQWSRYGRKAGPLRNAAMLALHPDVVYAYTLGTPGTENMMLLARAAGVPVIERSCVS